MAFMCAVGAAILEHKLVHIELFISTAEKPDRNRLISGGLLDGFPDVALVDMDLPGARKVEVFGPCVGFVADEFYFCPSTCLVFATVVDVLTGYVSQNNCPHDNFLEVNKRRRMCPGFVDSLLPLLYFLPPCGGRCRSAPRPRVPSDHNDALPPISYGPDRIKLVFSNPVAFIPFA
ncbi:hypothetical protein OS493_007439 [Desmophyllum pertusum]|uniref:Uncharacterized protein n=1 Tax=Desmophyllum pertusum TaxID=174260 RepID=A0A9W9Z3N4_9CNID|nr:hypothetical protein OS493_007439 [Desmophyllum pertusum]